MIYHLQKIPHSKFLLLYVQREGGKYKTKLTMFSDVFHYSVRFPGKLFKCRRTTVGLVSWYYIFNVCTYLGAILKPCNCLECVKMLINTATICLFSYDSKQAL